MSSPFPVKPINPLSAVLTARGITAEEAKAMEMASHSSEQIRELLGYNTYPTWLKGTFLPYHDLDGSHLLTDDKRLFCRWRLEMENGSPLPEGQKKYEQPAKSGTAVYLPVLHGINWVEVAHDPSVDLWVTEGEFKAISLVQAGVVAIGLGGVDNWREKSGRLARPFHLMELASRKLFVVYDADKESTDEHPLKPTVEAALHRLSARLGELGSEVYRLDIARTPTFAKARAKNPECKMGVDDYLKAGGTVEELLETIKRLQHNVHAARLMREYAVYTQKKPHVVRLADGVPFSAGDFHSLIEKSAVTEMREPATKPGAVGRKIKIKESEVWLENPSHLTISKYVFEPSSRPGYNHEDRTYNIWNGFAVEGNVEDGEGATYNQVVSDWRKFIKGIFGDWADYFEKWLAHVVQFPGVKTSIAILVATKLNGVGKSLLGEMVVDLIGGGENGHAVALELDRVVGTNFNAALRAKIFVQIDEASGRFSNYESKIKDLITSDTLAVELKGMDTVMVKNYLRLFLTSNALVPIRIDAHNRRVLVIRPDMPQEFATNEWEPWVSKAIGQGIRRSPHGLRMLRWYLDKVDLTGWDPQARVPVTDAMQDLVENSTTQKEELSDYLLGVLQEDEVGFWGVTSELRAKDKILWGELIANLKANGGRTCRHTIKVGTKAVAVVLLDPKAKLPIKQNAGKEWILDALRADLDKEGIQAACARASAAFDKWIALVPAGGGSKKF